MGCCSLLIYGGFSISFCFLAFIYGFCYFVNERFFLCCCDAILNIEFSAQLKECIKEQTAIAFCVQILLLQMLLNKSGKCLAGQGVAPTVYRQFAQYPQNSKPAFLHYALVCMPKAHHICSCVRSPYRFLKFNAATKQPNAPFTLQHIRSAFSHKNL